MIGTVSVPAPVDRNEEITKSSTDVANTTMTAGEDRRTEQRQQHESDRLHAGGAQIAGGFFVLTADGRQPASHDDHHERDA